jgi:hypothetical protein
MSMLDRQYRNKNLASLFDISPFLLTANRALFWLDDSEFFPTLI